jgi:DNA-binding NarL/FixJ family response regulator
MRVALVDDHGPMRALVRSVLEEDVAGVVVVGEAATGEDAVARVGTWGAQLIVMDWQMPGMNGVEATRRIRAGHPEIEVVGFTSSEEPALRDAFLEAGAAEQYTKDRIDALVDHVRLRVSGSVA